MIRRIRSKLHPYPVDILIYFVEKNAFQRQNLCDIALSIEKSSTGTGEKTRLVYRVSVDGRHVHLSTVSFRPGLPARFGFGQHPVIGNCVTEAEFRGKRIYPHMLNYILEDLFTSHNVSKAFILVDPRNRPSIKGIERAGFIGKTRLQATRIGSLYFRQSAIPIP